MNQIGSIKRIDQYERVYVPKQIMEALDIDKGSHCVWIEDEENGCYCLKKATVTIE